MYGPNNVRGFNPQIAGNVRLDGLYFDQQGGLSNRVVEGSTVRIGASEIGYAFPAPTGIVDYDLRHTGDGTASASAVAAFGPFEARAISLDAVLPVLGKSLQVPVGASWQVGTNTPSGNLPGYTSLQATFGATPEWRIGEDWRIRALFDWSRYSEARTLPYVFPAGDFEPALVQGYFGQDWAQGKTENVNGGLMVHGRLAGNWWLAAGLFRSISNSPLGYSDLYVDTRINGLADHVLIGYPDQFVASTSGEARVTGRFALDEWRHDVFFLLRGRDTQAYYGGSDSVDAGPAQIGQGLQVPEPDFQTSARTSDRVDLLSAGFGWRGQWDRRADFALGVQRESYRKTVAAPGAETTRIEDAPLRAYGHASYALASELSAYAGATQGLEDSGTAPTGAANHGAILPDARTWQADGGLSYAIAGSVKLIGGVFEIEKPYFNLDADNVDRQLAMERARGFELSVSGPIGKRLQLAFGALLGQYGLIGSNLAAQGIGPLAFGQPHFQSTLNADYTITSGISVDLAAFRASAAPASPDNVVRQSVPPLFALGGRYKFKIDGKDATLRLQWQNISNRQFWNFWYTPGYMEFTPRSLLGYLTVDL